MMTAAEFNSRRPDTRPPTTRLIAAEPQAKLGSGSVGEVWLARSGQREVAIKFINQPFTEAQRKSLETEIQTLRKLRHPAIPELYDFDLYSERPCIVMEYIDGETFQRIIADGTLWQIPMQRRLAILAEIAAAAAHLHERGLIHRDIKPANIIGIAAPHLIDYGIAAEIGKEISGAGTPFYMMPDDHPPSIAHDLFGFALTVYEFLFGVHAIFTAQDCTLRRDEVRGIAVQRLREGSWRVPSRIPTHELPYDLRGVDLPVLDALFERAFDWNATNPTSSALLTELIKNLTTAILTPENQSFLEKMPEIAALTISGVPDTDVPSTSTVHVADTYRARTLPLVIGTVSLLVAIISLMLFLQNLL